MKEIPYKYISLTVVTHLLQLKHTAVLCTWATHFTLGALLHSGEGQNNFKQGIDMKSRLMAPWTRHQTVNVRELALLILL